MLQYASISACPVYMEMVIGMSCVSNPQSLCKQRCSRHISLFSPVLASAVTGRDLPLVLLNMHMIANNSRPGTCAHIKWGSCPGTLTMSHLRTTAWLQVCISPLALAAIPASYVIPLQVLQESRCPLCINCLDTALLLRIFVVCQTCLFANGTTVICSMLINITASAAHKEA